MSLFVHKFSISSLLVAPEDRHAMLLTPLWRLRKLGMIFLRGARLKPAGVYCLSFFFFCVSLKVSVLKVAVGERRLGFSEVESTNYKYMGRGENKVGYEEGLTFTESSYPTCPS